MNENCKGKGCSVLLEEKKTQGLLFLTRNIFGVFGHRLVVGYCRVCARKNLAQAWMAMIIIISTVIAIVEFPWKGPLFAIVVVGVWTGICWSWLFPKR